MSKCYAMALLIIGVVSVELFAETSLLFKDPVGDAGYLLQKYGNERSPGQYHVGIDINPWKGKPEIHPTAPGEVVVIQRNGPCASANEPGGGCVDHGLGNAIIIKHKLPTGQSIFSLYGHLDSVAASLEVGTRVTQADVIGIMGASGYGLQDYWKKADDKTPAVHLHFELKDRPVLHDPKGGETPSCASCYGYVPGNPDEFGYHDPGLFFDMVSVATGSLGIPERPVSNPVSAGCPTVSINIPEEIIRRPPVIDPAADTAITDKLIQTGLSAVTSSMRATLAVEGEAFAEVLGRFGSFEQARARVEVSVIESSSGRILMQKAIHDGGIDLTQDAAAKRALQRAGERMGELLAQELSRILPAGCVKLSALTSSGQQVAVSDFTSTKWTGDWDARRGMKEEMERALSAEGMKVVLPVAADVIIGGTITDYKVVYQDIGIPFLNLFIRTGVSYMSVEPQALNLETSEIERGYEIRDFSSGFEFFGFRFGFGAQAIAQKISGKIVNWVKSL